MALPSWPQHEILPVDEIALLQLARLRSFGANYLQGAICPELELIAHPDGSKVVLLPFSNTLPCTSGACTAIIDPQSQQSNTATGEDISKRSTGSSGVLGPVRGLAWSSRRTPQASKKASETTRGIGAENPEISCHLAIAWGSNVRLWKVSRSMRGKYSTVEVNTDWGDIPANEGETTTGDVQKTGASQAQGVSLGTSKATPANISAIQAADGEVEKLSARVWDSTGVKSTLETVRDHVDRVEVGNRAKILIYCLKCAPAPDKTGNTINERQEVPEKEDKEALSLAAWHTGGLTILQPGGVRRTLAAPVPNKRTCGSWSGCGTRLAISSGGELRVYNPTSTNFLIPCNSHERSEPPEQLEPKQPGVVSTSPQGSGSKDNPPPGANDVGRETEGAEISSGNICDFRTILCVEAIMQRAATGTESSSHGGVNSQRMSPLTMSRGSSPISSRGTHSTLSPGRPPEVPVFVGSPSCPIVPIGHRESASTWGSPETLAPSPSLVGDMRAMCSGGTDAFFGTTDGGLGLNPPSTGGLTPNDTSIGSSKVGNVYDRCTGGHERTNRDSLVKALVSDSLERKASETSKPINTITTRVSDACGEPMAVATSRETTPVAIDDYVSPVSGNVSKQSVGRHGFRHALSRDDCLVTSPGQKACKSAPDLGRERRSDSRSPGLSALALETSSVTLPVHTNPQAAEDTGAETAEVVESADIAVGTAIPVGKSAGGDAAPMMPILRGTGVCSPAPISCPSSPQLTSSVMKSLSLPSPPTPPEMLDLRGKLGNCTLAGGPSAELHPLFRLSLGVELDPSSSCTNPKSTGLLRTVQPDSAVSSDTAGTSRREPLLVRVTMGNDRCHLTERGVGREAAGIEIEAIARLPPALASPDLIASSADGNLVAVGSHACGLVACYRLTTQHGDVDGTHSVLKPSALNATGKLGSGKLPIVEAETTTKVGRRSRAYRSSTNSRRYRRAKALCTLRLPSEYRAKGLVFENGTSTESQERSVTVTNSTTVLVLASAPASSNASFGKKSPRGCMADLGGTIPTRTVLLRFILPKFADTKIVPSTVTNAIKESAKMPTTSERGELKACPSPRLRGERAISRETFRASEEDPLDRDGSFRLSGSESPVSQEGLVIRGGNSTTWTYPVSPRDSNVSPFLLECPGSVDGRLGSPLSGLAIDPSVHTISRRSSNLSRKPLHGTINSSDGHRGDGEVSTKRRGVKTRGNISGEDVVGKFGCSEPQADSATFVEVLQHMEARMMARFDGIEHVLDSMSERLGSLEHAVGNSRL